MTQIQLKLKLKCYRNVARVSDVHVTHAIFLYSNTARTRHIGSEGIEVM